MTIETVIKIKNKIKVTTPIIDNLENPLIIIDEFHNLSENDMFGKKSEIKKLFDSKNKK